MFEHIAEFTTWPILTGILVGYIANRIMSGEGKGCCMILIHYCPLKSINNSLKHA